MERALRCCLIATSVFGLLGAGGARADDRYDVARVSDQRGSLAVRGTEEDDYSFLERNSVLREGDVLWTDESGRAELELEQGSWIRLAEDTKIEFRRLGKSPELRLWSGSLYADLSDRVDGVLRIKTPVGDVDVRKDSLVRVDLSGEQGARVSLHNGGAEVFADKGEAVRLGPGERLYLQADRVPGEIKRFDRSDLDGFDRYHRERVDYYLERPYPRELSDDVAGARELRDYGSWVSVDNSSYWRPNVISSWRPYSNGYWSYMSGPGMTWIDYAPWGYTTSHYGRWMYRPVYGWLWSPGFVWGPAFVSFATYGDYYGWAPLDPWERPAYYGPGSFSSVNFVFDNRSWNFCRRDHFFYSRHHRNFGGGGYNGGRYFHRAEDLVIDKSRFGLVRDANREIGVPDKRIRGPLLGKDGIAARERVASNEQKLPGKRLDQIQKRFGENPRRDLEKTRASTGIERLQRSPGLALGKENVIKGDDALRRTLGKGRAADNGPENGIGKPDVTRDRANAGGGTGGTGRTGVGTPNPDRDSPFRRGNDGGPKAIGPGQGGDSPFRKNDGNRDTQPNRNPVDNSRKENDDRQRAEKERADRDRQHKEQADRDRQQKDQKDQQERERQQRDQQERQRQDQERQRQDRDRQERDRQERDRQDRGKKFDGPTSPFDDNRYRRDGGSGGNNGPSPNGGGSRGDVNRGDNRSPFAGDGTSGGSSRTDNSRGDNRSPFTDYRRGSQPGGSNGLAPNRGADSPFVRRDPAPSTYRDFPNSGESRTYTPPPAVQRSGGESPFNGNRSGYSGGSRPSNTSGSVGSRGGYSGGSTGGYSGGTRGGGYSGGGNRGGGSSGGGRSGGGGGGGGRLPGK